MLFKELRHLIQIERLNNCKRNKSNIICDLEDEFNISIIQLQNWYKILVDQ